MTVVLSILFASVVGGLLFMLIDRWGREPSTASPEPTRELWTPAPPAATSLFTTSNTPAPFTPRGEEPTRPLPPSRGLWDDPPKRDEDDDEHRPPGLWSGWAR